MNAKQANEPKKRGSRTKKQPVTKTVPPAPAQEIQIRESVDIATEVVALPPRPQPRRPVGLLKRTTNRHDEGGA